MKWSVDQVVAWLIDNDLADLDEKFVAHRIDGKRLLALTDDEMLNVLKIRSSTIRGLLMEKIKAIMNSAAGLVSNHDAVGPVTPTKDQMCTSHGKPLHAFCRQDCMLICFECLLTTHFKHDYCSPKDAFDEKKKALEKTKASLQAHEQESEQLLSEVAYEIVALQSSLEKASSDAECLFSELHDLIELRKRDMFDDLNRIHAECLKPLEEIKKAHKEAVLQSQALIVDIESILSQAHEMTLFHSESNAISDKAKAVLHFDASSQESVMTNKKPRISVYFSEKKLKSLQETMKSFGTVKAKGD
jgi:hypothetical protein